MCNKCIFRFLLFFTSFSVDFRLFDLHPNLVEKKCIKQKAEMTFCLVVCRFKGHKVHYFKWDILYIITSFDSASYTLLSAAQKAYSFLDIQDESFNKNNSLQRPFLYSFTFFKLTDYKCLSINPIILSSCYKWLQVNVCYLKSF